MGLFDFLLADDYESRKVGRFDAAWGFVSTAYVNDAEQPYETAVKHKNYNNGKMVIVQTYDTKENAKSGHVHWVEVMTGEALPERLVDRGTSGISQLVDAFSGDNEWRINQQDEARSNEAKG